MNCLIATNSTNMNSSTRTGFLIFAHGSRDPAWRVPFDQMLNMARDRAQEPVELAFLESMEPNLTQGVQALFEQGARHIVITPIFLAAGSHIRQDLPQLVRDIEKRLPGLHIEIQATIGENAFMQTAMVNYALMKTSGQ